MGGGVWLERGEERGGGAGLGEGLGEGRVRLGWVVGILWGACDFTWFGECFMSPCSGVVALAAGLV